MVGLRIKLLNRLSLNAVWEPQLQTNDYKKSLNGENLITYIESKKSPYVPIAIIDYLSKASFIIIN